MGKYLGVSNESMKILSVVGTNQYNISYNNEVYIYSGVHWYLYVANGSVRIDNAFYVKDLNEALSVSKQKYIRYKKLKRITENENK